MYALINNAIIPEIKTLGIIPENIFLGEITIILFDTLYLCILFPLELHKNPFFFSINSDSSNFLILYPTVFKGNFNSRAISLSLISLSASKDKILFEVLFPITSPILAVLGSSKFNIIELLILNTRKSCL